MATIRDIAREAGYSIATVSRVLNHDHTLSVSDGAREKIFKTAEELNYKTVRQRSAEKKRSRKNLRFGMVYFHSEKQEMNDPYFLAIRLGIEKTCSERGIELIKIYRTEKGLDLKRANDCDAILVIGSIHPEEIDQLTLCTENITFVDHSPLESMFDSVVIDFRTAMSSVLDHLNELGHTRIGFIGGKQNTHLGEELMDERERVFREHLLLQGSLRPEDIFTGEFKTEEGYRLMKAALQQDDLPTAFFVASDSMAIGAMRALHEQKYRVPEDLSLVGFNDIAASRYLQPALTTIKVYTEFMGETAVEIAEERLGSDRDVPRKIVIPTVLIKRESTAPAKEISAEQMNQASTRA
ncbi:LacI family DNA-binding transcriptional regulator [Alkalicoccus chagannorensis]|uniref:LacI family DNA-binding transcriptional regulator n=1 Tax=Alkalicoccus chagannorensis TaxID=427072 RepID=UPI00047E0990|nr:LacI family DNA-binding transcriptional regulator [Alkalicoccus chagannorensis]